MNEKVTFSPWNENWVELQRQYWDAWSRLSQETLAATPDKSSPWALGLEHWWKAVSGATPETAHEFMERLVQQGKAFLQLSEEYTRFANQMSEAGQAAAPWQELLQSRISDLKSLLSEQDPSGVTEALRGMLPFFALPVDTWTRTFSVASLFPGDFLETWKPVGLERARDQLHDRIGRFLSVPGVGYTREWQEQNQRTGRLFLDYDKALQEYLRLHGKLGIDALERLSKKLLELEKKGQEINTLRDIYDLWVDSGEEAYNALVFTEEYRDTYARMVNSLMALKHHSQSIMDEAMGALNLPTRKGMTTLLCRQQELRREVVALRAQLDQTNARGREGQLQTFVADLVALREEVAALKTSPARTATGSTVPTRATGPVRTATAKNAAKPRQSKRA